MLPVPAGPFLKGPGKGKRTVIQNAYCIDRTEVTVAAYARCVDAGKCDKLDGQGKSCNWTRWKKDKKAWARHPVNCVNWHDAVKYCKYAGNKRLPTEKEWERAARGTDGRKYPWGNDAPSCRLAVYDDQKGGKTNNGCGRNSTWPVCSRTPAGDSPVGACDMAGNLWEWTQDLYQPGRSWRVLRGGSWDFNNDDLPVFDRLIFLPAYRNDDLGFRCASVQ